MRGHDGDDPGGTVGEYRYDPEDLTDTVEGLGRLKDDYESASQVREESAAVFGYAGLAGAVETFVENWTKHRERQLETLTGTRDSLRDITENYVEHDAAGAAELRDGGS